MVFMGFSSKWISWISGYLSSAKTSVLVNESPTDEFYLHRGLRQGNLLSPFLFIMIMEGLHIAVKDDMPLKMLFLLGVSYDEVQRLALLTGCNSQRLPFVYLGLPIAENMAKQKGWEPIVGKFNNRMSRWKASMLSIGGRTTLLSSVLGALEIRNLQISSFKLQKEVMNTIWELWNKFGVELPNLKSVPGVDSNTSVPSHESPIVQVVDINKKQTSYAGAAGASTKDQPKVCSNFRPLVANPVFDGVNISIPRKVIEKVSSHFKHTLYGYFIEKRMAFRVVEYYARNNWAKDGLKRIMMNNKGFFFFNGGQFAGPSIKQNVRYELKETTSAPKKGATNVGDAQKKGATVGSSSKNDNIFTSNSYSTLNVVEEDDDEVVENVYDESANIFTNSQSGGSSSFTVAAG
nr:RNA-directed DNA polymerase, eukaryota, reverse transcriptase zinc-binding domain protein [Tanacetum cinerariifolium]